MCGYIFLTGLVAYLTGLGSQTNGGRNIIPANTCGATYTMSGTKDMVMLISDNRNFYRRCSITLKVPPGYRIAIICPSFHLSQKGCLREEFEILEKYCGDEIKSKFCMSGWKGRYLTKSSSVTVTHRRKRLVPSDKSRGYTCAAYLVDGSSGGITFPPFGTTTPSPFGTTTPSPFGTTTPSPFGTTAPSPFVPTTPSPSNRTGIQRPFCDRCGLSHAEAGSVVGVAPASEGEYPWMALLGMGCSGSLIKAEWILTAAHCFEEGKDPLKYTVTLGKTNLNKVTPGSLIMLPKEVILHEYFIRSSYVNDIALVRLPRKVTFTDTIKPVCIGKDTDIPFESSAVSTGFGIQKFGTDGSPSRLQEVKLDVITESRCRMLGNANEKYFICAIMDKDTCQGDAGGPMVAQVTKGMWVQVGIVSYGQGCAIRNSPGMYTRVPAYLSWIAQKTNSTTC